MATLWERIRALEGRTLPTVTGREAFDVIGVDEDHLRVVPRSFGKPRPIPRWCFEQAEALGLVTADITPIRLRQADVSEFNPTYVAAIIRAVVGADFGWHDR